MQAERGCRAKRSRNRPAQDSEQRTRDGEDDDGDDDDEGEDDPDDLDSDGSSEARHEPHNQQPRNSDLRNAHLASFHSLCTNRNRKEPHTDPTTSRPRGLKPKTHSDTLETLTHAHLPTSPPASSRKQQHAAAAPVGCFISLFWVSEHDAADGHLVGHSLTHPLTHFQASRTVAIFRVAAHQQSEARDQRR